MNYQFELLSWTDKMAYNEIDKTIRIEAGPNIPWAGEKWRTNNCVTRESGKQVQKWNPETHRLEWVQTPEKVYFGGLPTAKQEELVPIIATSLTAQLIRYARQNKNGCWLVENEEKIKKEFGESAEDGVLFDKDQQSRHLKNVQSEFERYALLLKNEIPDALYRKIESVIQEYTELPLS